LNRIFHYVAFGIAAAILISGCSAPTTDKSATKTGPKEPDLTLQVASLNLSGFNKRFEKSEINKFSKLLKKEQVDVLSVQNITRYPGVESRVDFVNELVARSEMRYSFGEMVNSSGRQSGNGIFSLFPMRNTHNDAFDGVQSATFEAALQASVDGGVRDVIVVSTTLPPKAPESDQSACLRTIASKSVALPGQPMIVTGNLPESDGVKEKKSYDEVSGSTKKANERDPHTRIWYSKDGSLNLLGTRTVETEFGPMVVAQFGLFR
jgi:endonuclease/exonuclease/phosphatase family metal-dependent hydrolase